MTKKAGAVSEETKTHLLQAAKDEFTERGFQDSSLRRICASAGVTTGALYFFFNGKDDLFETVISEVTVPLMDFLNAHYDTERDFLNKDANDNNQEDIKTVTHLLDFYYNNKQTCDILLSHLNHPAVQSFMDQIIDTTTEHYMMLIEMADTVYHRKYTVDLFGVHWFAHLQVDTMLTLVSHGFTRKEVLEHSKTIIKMMQGAFMALLSD